MAFTIRGLTPQGRNRQWSGAGADAYGIVNVKSGLLASLLPGVPEVFGHRKDARLVLKECKKMCIEQKLDPNDYRIAKLDFAGFVR